MTYTETSERTTALSNLKRIEYPTRSFQICMYIELCTNSASTKHKRENRTVYRPHRSLVSTIFLYALILTIQQSSPFFIRNSFCDSFHPYFDERHNSLTKTDSTKSRNYQAARKVSSFYRHVFYNGASLYKHET